MVGEARNKFHRSTKHDHSSRFLHQSLRVKRKTTYVAVFLFVRYPEQPIKPGYMLNRFKVFILSSVKKTSSRENHFLQFGFLSLHAQQVYQPPAPVVGVEVAPVAGSAVGLGVAGIGVGVAPVDGVVGVVGIVAGAVGVADVPTVGVVFVPVAGFVF